MKVRNKCDKESFLAKGSYLVPALKRPFSGNAKQFKNIQNSVLFMKFCVHSNKCFIHEAKYSKKFFYLLKLKCQFGFELVIWQKGDLVLF